MPDDIGTPASCTCPDCQSACSRKPGWLVPDDVDRIAAHLGLSRQQLFDRWLLVDWWDAGADIDHDVFLLSPAIIGSDRGGMYPGDPHGTCVFYRGGRCDIHAVKPHECQVSFHTHTDEQVHEWHLGTAQAWDSPGHQKEVRQLLGEQPVKGGYDIFDALTWMLDDDDDYGGDDD